MSSRARGCVLVALVLGAVLLAPAGAPAAPDHRQAAAAVELVRQTPSVRPGGAAELVLLGERTVPGTEVTVRVHDRVRSRTELARSATRTDLRRTLHQLTRPLEELPVEADGARRVALDLGDAAGGNDAVTVPGVYPVTVDLDDRPGFVTHLVVGPAETAASPLAVAVLVSIDDIGLDEMALADATALVGTLNAAPDVAATLAVRPDTIDRVAATTEDSPGGALLGALREASGRDHLALPFAPVTPDALARSGIAEELRHQLEHGSAVLRAATGAVPVGTTWIAGPGLGAEGLALLRSAGIRHLLLEPEQVQPVADGVLTVARPFRVLPPRGGRSATGEGPAVDALVRDERLEDSLATEGSPALVASRVLADLASLWFEQEDVARSVVLPVDPSLDHEALAAVLDGLRSAALFRAVPIDEAFTAAAPLLTPRGDTVERSLEPDGGDRLGAPVAASIRAARALRESFASMVEPSAGALRALDTHLLRASSDGLDDDERRRELALVRSTVDDFTEGITTPERFTITLTARSGTVPLNVRNDTGEPVELRVRLRSSRLDLPDGDTFTLRLDEETTRHDVAVRTRASGSFEVEVELTSPDGNIDVSTSRFSVRSTAVSGVGLVLSAGAGLFLVGWWARHWREARRSAKLIDSAHPVHRTPS